MENLVIYIHGQGGNIEEAKHYEALFPDSDVIGFDYQSEFPWDAKKEFAEFFDKVCSGYKSVTLVANSLGAFLAMSSLAEKKIDKAYFISPVVDMQKLILDMMTWANVSEDQLREKGIIDTAFGQQLSWKYLTYVRNNPITWRIPTAILYGDIDNLTSMETISNFADQTGASLTVMKDGEHWFHTEEQMAFLDQWIRDLK